jgi:hypothetical protein
LNALEDLLQDATAGDPMTGLKWTRKTLEKLARGLRRRGYRVGRETVRRLLGLRDYSLRTNHKRLSKRRDVERDRQMRYIARKRRAFLKAKKPVISADGKKKEPIGNFKNAGRTWRRQPLDVLATDFPSDAEGKASLYGVYDVARNRGVVGVGVSHETAPFAVNVIRMWWRREGRHAYPDADELLIQVDAGGANGYRSWGWKWALQQFADKTGLTLTVMHYPTSASKWNLIEHRLFNHISANWAGQPLVSYETIVNFIRTTCTKQGLTCYAYRDTADYPTGVKITPEQQELINLVSGRVLPKWNYTIKPRAGRQK